MFFKICTYLLISSIVTQNVDCATKKSWKSAANFDTDLPIFTPFKKESELMHNVKVNEVQPETTLTPSSPSPSAETFTKSGKLRSKFRVPVHPDLKTQETHNTEVKDFGKFDNNEAYEAEKTAMKEVETDIVNDTINIEQVLGQLNDEADKASITAEATDSSVDSEDDLEISSIPTEQTNVTQFKVGSLMNLTLNDEENVVKVNLDQGVLKQIFTGRGRRNNIFERIIPLFILPFLIQSAAIPFMITMIKLFLMKSIVAGKIAVLLLVLGAFRNHQNSLYMKSMHSPYYVKDFNSNGPYNQHYPERRIETGRIEADGLEGYQVEGKPLSYVN